MPNVDVARDERGRALQLHPAMAAKKWQPGFAPNPTGKGGLYQELRGLMRKKSQPAAERIFQIAKLDEIGEDGRLSELSGKDDIRCILQASFWVWEQAWGKAKEYDPSKDEISSAAFDPSAYTPEELLILRKLLMKAVQPPTQDVVSDTSAVVTDVGK